MRFLVIMFLILIGGCSTPVHEYEDGYYWWTERKWESIPQKDWVYHVISNPKDECAKHVGTLVDACAVILVENEKSKCHIFISPSISARLKAHEEKHCNGFAHW